MSVPSFTFLAAAVIGAVLFNLLPSVILRRYALLAFNIGFFAQFAPSVAAALPYAVFLALGYGSLYLARRNLTRPAFAGLIVVAVLLFCWLKRYGFFPEATFLPFLYLTVGLSYVFFRVLHLIIEVGQHRIEERISPLGYLNYVLHFPALIAGPIQLYPDFRAMERDSSLPLTIKMVGEAAWRISLGFFKVAIVSFVLLHMQENAIAALRPDFSLFGRAIAIGAIGALYPLYLYANFSGYTDFVIGIALLYRMKLPENFDRPFSAENFIAFWSRWHITLSGWLKAYVYTPIVVAGMRRYPARSAEAYLGVAAYFVTFFLVGVWHGQTTMFVAFGVLQGGGVATNKLFQIWMTRRLGRKGYNQFGKNSTYRAVCRALTFTWFGFTLLWFWSSWNQLGVFTDVAGVPAVILGWALVFVVAMVVLALLQLLRDMRHDLDWCSSRYTRAATMTVMVLAIVTFSILISGPAPQIVYKNF